MIVTLGTFIKEIKRNSIEKLKKNVQLGFEVGVELGLGHSKGVSWDG